MFKDHTHVDHKKRDNNTIYSFRSYRLSIIAIMVKVSAYAGVKICAGVNFRVNYRRGEGYRGRARVRE